MDTLSHTSKVLDHTSLHIQNSRPSPVTDKKNVFASCPQVLKDRIGTHRKVRDYKYSCNKICLTEELDLLRSSHGGNYTEGRNRPTPGAI